MQTKEQQRGAFSKERSISPSERVFMQATNLNDKGVKDFLQEQAIDPTDPRAVFAHNGLNKAMHPSAKAFFGGR